MTAYKAGGGCVHAYIQAMTLDELLSRLVIEVFQTEESAKEHPRKEAERLGETPPGAAMLAVSAHAARALAELGAIAEGLGYHRKEGVGVTIGKTFSLVREAVVDRMLSQEKNYRGTLLGMQHGVDLFVLVEAAARRAGKTQLALFCARWLEERRPLVEAARAQVPWFAEHVDQAG